MSNTVHITTAIPYVNAKPHLGHVLEWFQADSMARYFRLLGKEVSFTSGTDENSLKNVQAAEKAGKAPQDWLDEYAEIFEKTYQQFGISLTGFRRGSDKEKHWPGVQTIWNICDQAGDIYKKSYTGQYCMGCESFYTQDELVDGKCPEHLTVPETVTEENYFFRLSKYEDQIRELIASNKLRIVSQQFKNEMLGFIDQGLEDFSISRSVERARGFGVPVPGDDTQIMYVWFDALIIYLTAIGWGYDNELFQTFWNDTNEKIHVIGKGINRFHSVYWIGMLLSAGLPTPTSISVHGYITANGQKMSKSLGNVIDPYEVIEKYGLEPVRYYLLKYIPTHSDGDFSYEKFLEVYNADLANGIGNLCSRVAKLCEKADLTLPRLTLQMSQQYIDAMDAIELDKAIGVVMNLASELDKSLADSQPWKKDGDERRQILEAAVEQICLMAFQLQPFMPETAQKILTHFAQEKVTALSPLFPRLS
jgi:methionyl-tRNA synthetase